MVPIQEKTMKLDALDHPKTLDLAARLRVEIPTAIGHLELLWAFTGKKSPQGNIGKWPDGAIANACYWRGEPEAFIDALLESGFLDHNETYRLLVHDWPDHAPRWVKSKLKTLGVTFISTADQQEGEGTETPPPTESKDNEGDTSDDTSHDTPSETQDDTKGSEVKGSEGKTKHILPDWLDRKAWGNWEKFRKEIRKPITPKAFEAQIDFLDQNREVHAAIIEQSIRCSWAGLFPLKNGGFHAPHQRTDNSAIARVRAANGIKR